MLSDSSIAAPPPSATQLASSDIRAILREKLWLDPQRIPEDSAPFEQWCARAAQLLGPQASSKESLIDLLALVFSYDATALLGNVANQAVLAREGAREVIRELANRVLDGGEVESDRFKEIIDGMKAALPYRGRSLFFPIRLALGGRTGEGEVDRVILLLDAAAKLNFTVAVKGTRGRMIEFCAALD